MEQEAIKYFIAIYPTWDGGDIPIINSYHYPKTCKMLIEIESKYDNAE